MGFKKGQEHRPLLKSGLVSVAWKWTGLCMQSYHCTALMTDMDFDQPRVLKFSSFRGESRQDLSMKKFKTAHTMVPAISQFFQGK